MRVLHLFDRYLNHTMNWAWRLLKYGPPKPLVAAPLLVENRFLDSDFTFLPPFWPRRFSTEWEITRFHQALSSLAWKYSRLYQHFLYRKLRSNPPQLLHAHFAQTGWYFLDLAKALKRPLLVSFYGYDYERLPQRNPVWRQRYAVLFRQARAFFVEGEHGAFLLRSMGCPEEKIRILPLGVELPPESLSSPEKEAGVLQLIQAATFTEKKGQMDTLQAFHQALHQAPNMQLTFVGEKAQPEVFSRLQTYVKNHQLEGKVQFVDFVPFGKFYSFLAQHHLFLHPSRYAADGDCEGGAPVVLLDAQALGLPVVSTRHCDIPSRVLHEKTGLLCEEGDVDGLARALLYFYQMPLEEYRAFQKAARQFVRESFEARLIGRKLEALYRTFC